MYLKKIDIQGFKSFPDKTEIKFKDNITAIVGPNGSGKSNISDAIRWVLGEQSIKSLRGNKMEDIIFSGTGKRRALSFAEVTIYFDNADKSILLDYDEVAVTRRVFRSGESEYYINKNACRLKDIRSIFMDTGIGKDGYSIIGQGRIDEILSDRPEDRRNIFEEAAGIVKYKTKKEESQRKLKNTEDNLVRINDLISEISDNNKRLEKESKKAGIFISTFEELKDLETNIYIRDIKDIDKKIMKFNIDKENIEFEIDENESRKIEKQDIFELLKSEMQIKEKEIDGLRDKRDEILKVKDESKNNISLLLERENFNNKDLQRLNNELENIIAENLELDANVLILEKKAKESSSKHDEVILKQEKEKSDLNEVEKEIISKEKKIELENKEMNLLYGKIADKKGRLNNFDYTSGNIENEKKELKSEKERLVKKTNSLNRNIKLLNSDIGKEKNNLEVLGTSKHELEEKQNNIQTTIDKNSKEIRQLEMKIGKTNSDYRLYKNMQNSYEGYFKSVKNLILAIKNNKLSEDGFHGIVADLIEVDKKYETAINIALGGNLQNVVVDNDINAQSMIDYLKKNRLGRVTFLPISIIKGNKYNFNIENSKNDGILGLANKLIQYENKYENIFESLLGRTIIMDNIENAITFAKKTNHRYRIVTLEGEILNPGGSLSGGSYRSNISIINRKNKIKEIEISLSTLKSKLSLLKEEDRVFNSNFKTIKEKAKITGSEYESLNMKIINLENDIKSLVNEESFILEEIRKTASQITTIVERSEEELENSIEDKEFLKTNNKKLKSMEESIEEERRNLIYIKNRKEELNKKVNSIEIERNILKNKIINFEDEIKKSIRKKDVNTNFKEQKLVDINVIEKNLIDIMEEKEDSNNKTIESSKKELKIKEDIKISTKDKDIQMDKFYKEQDNLKMINENINKLDKAKNKMELSISKFELQKNNIINKLFEDYKLNLEQAYLLERPIEDIKISRERIKSLKKVIRELGNVNLSSIEEYKEVNERFKFMSTQQQDLIESKESLNEIIEDMESEMEINFSKSFNVINENFSEVFKELFDGGEATLELDDKENILTSGIEIKAKPPGKVLQNLSLLSGGEKSLVAVALLFAILKTKPAPFSILDEIDASLDDANISKYTSYLKKINKNTQFILITHRKVSMEIANILYGVTMEEEGISRIISMELKDKKNKLVS